MKSRARVFKSNVLYLCAFIWTMCNAFAPNSSSRPRNEAIVDETDRSNPYEVHMRSEEHAAKQRRDGQERHQLHILRNHRRLLLQQVIAVAVLPGFPALSRAAAGATKQNSDMLITQNGQVNRRIGGLASRIRAVGTVMDELQRDLMQERWTLVEAYPAQLRSYVPVFTTYTDSAFPTDAPTDKGLRVALRYEVGRFFACVERLKQATQRKALDEAYIAYSEMSLHFDRYLRVGGLYSYYDDTVSTEVYFKGFSDDQLVYADPNKDPPLVRDLIVMIQGPDKGKTGIVIGKYLDGSNKCVVKLDRYKGIREIRVVANSWVGKRLGEQDPDDVFLLPRKRS